MLAATNSGLFRSADAGRANWTRVLSGCIADVKFDPRDNGYAVAGENIGAGQGGRGVVHDGRRAYLDRRRSSDSLGGTGGTRLCGQNPDIVYASVQMTSGAIWRSDDGGATYQSKRDPCADGSAAPVPGRPGLVRQRDLGRRPHR